ncbi:MAG: glycosyltransferase family 4 protein [Bacillota bacterium]|nr:glycosyltransferase family 4 protein [Bacillota bacterium]
MGKIVIIGGLSSSLLRFRGDLIRSWVEMNYSVTAAAPGQEAAEDLEMLGVAYREIPLERTGLNPLRDLALFFSLKKLLAIEKPDYLFLYTIKPVIYGSLAAYFNPRVKVFSMITGLGYVFGATSFGGSLLRGMVIFLYRLAARRNRRIIFQNPDDRNCFVNLKIIDAARTEIVNGSGINLQYFKAEPLPIGPVHFLLIARLIREKGIHEYLEAARMVHDKYPEAKFSLIGWSYEGSPSAIKGEELKKSKEQGIVEYIEQTDDVRPYLARASVYVLPSYMEGTPRTVLEAMAVGRPVITTDAPGCRETVIDGENGFLVPVKNSKALAEAMEKFILEPALIEKMGEVSRRLAEEKYDVYKVNEVINRAMGLV